MFHFGKRLGEWRRACFWALALPGFAVSGVIAGRAQTPDMAYYWQTLAGAAGFAPQGLKDGKGSAAQFYWPFGICYDAASGNLYVADSNNTAIRRITPAGEVTTLLASQWVQISASPVVYGYDKLVGYAQGVTTDATGNLVIANTLPASVIVVTPAGVPRLLAGGAVGAADGKGAAAQFNLPRGVAVDAAGNVFVTDSGNATIRKITPDGTVTTFAGAAGQTGTADGQGGAARFQNPWGIVIDARGNLYVTDDGAIRRITPQAEVTTVQGKSAAFAPQGIALDGAGRILFTDPVHHTVRRIDPLDAVSILPLTGTPTAVVSLGGQTDQAGGADGIGGAATFYVPASIAVDPAGNLYVADSTNSNIRIGRPTRAPTVVAVPQSGAVAAGARVTLAVTTDGVPAPTLQWSHNGQVIAGATSATYVIAAVAPDDAGTYAVTATNALGHATTTAAALAVVTPPVLTTQPQSMVAGPDGNVLLSAGASGTAPFTYQWQRDGLVVPGATTVTLATTFPGHYAVTITNAAGSVTSSVAIVEWPAWLANGSVFGPIGGANDLTMGFGVTAPAGTGKRLLLRGVGPGLRAVGVGLPATRTALTVYSGATQIGVNSTGWSDDSHNLVELIKAAETAGAFPLLVGSADSALLVNLGAGSYTAELNSPPNVAGLALAEIYETDSDAGRLTRFSARGTAGAQPLTAGLVVRGTQSAKFLVRAIGPGLAPFGIRGALARTTLRVYSGTGANVVATNAGWSAAANASDLATVAGSVGAFALAADSGDSAVLVTLPAGTWLAEAASPDGSAGAVLIEVYQVGP